MIKLFTKGLVFTGRALVYPMIILYEKSPEAKGLLETAFLLTFAFVAQSIIVLSILAVLGVL